MSEVDPRLEEFLAFHEARDKRHIVAGLSQKVRDAISSDDANLAATLAIKIGYSIGADIAMLVRRRDRPRRLGKSRANQQAKVEADRRGEMAREIFDEYSADDVKRLGKGNIEREIGEVLQRQLNLPKPVSARTVREYLRNSGSG